MNEFNEKANTNLDDVDVEDSFSNKPGLPGIVSPPSATDEHSLLKGEDNRSNSMKKSQKKVASHIYNTLNSRTGTAETNEEASLQHEKIK